jgi:hypothetical protein
MAESKVHFLSLANHKFWMGFNGFVLLFLAVNIATIGVEIDSRFPFLIALGYLVYMFVYLSKGERWKLIALFSIAICGVLIYLIGLIIGRTGGNLYPMAWTHIILSAVLLGGAFAHLKTAK